MGANSPYTHTKVLKITLLLWFLFVDFCLFFITVWERAPIQYGSELAKQPLKMTWIRFCLFVLLAGLFV